MTSQCFGNFCRYEDCKTSATSNSLTGEGMSTSPEPEEEMNVPVQQPQWSVHGEKKKSSKIVYCTPHPEGEGN